MWLSGSIRSFLYSSSVYSCHLFLISSASVKFIQFLSFTVPIFAWNIPLVFLIYLKRSLVFPNLLFSTEQGFLSLLAILWNSAFKWLYLSFSPLAFTSLLFTATCKRSSDSHFAFFHLFFLGKFLIPASLQCHKPPSIVLQALCLSDLIPWINLFVTSTVRDLI